MVGQLGDGQLYWCAGANAEEVLVLAKMAGRLQGRAEGRMIVELEGRK